MTTRNPLPHPFKLAGLLLAAAAFLVPVILGAFHAQPWEATEGRRQLAETVIVFGCLLMVLSREKVEDEFVTACRLKAFRAALIAGTVYFLMDAFNTFSGNIFNSSFGLLIMELGVYLLLFHALKAGLFSHGQ